MKMFLSIYLTYFLASLIWLEIKFSQFKTDEKYVKRVTKKDMQIVDYKLMSFRVVDLNADQGLTTLEVLSNERHSFENSDKPIVIKADVPREQIETIKSAKTSQSEADLQVVINTRNNIPQIQTKIVRVAEYI